MTAHCIVIVAGYPAHPDFPKSRAGGRRQDPQESALPRPVRSEECDGFAGRHRKVDPAQGPFVSVPLGEAGHVDRGYCR